MMKASLVRFVACVCVALPTWGVAISAPLEIHHINVGQGDSTLIIGPNGTIVLIDAGDAGYFGNPNGGEIVFEYLEDQGITHLDYIVVTHRDADHVGGFAFGASVTYPESLLFADRVSGSIENYPGTADHDDDGDGKTDFDGDDGCGADAIEVPDPQEIGYGGTDPYFPQMAAFDNEEEGTTTYCNLSKTFRRYIQSVTSGGVRFPLGSYTALMAQYNNPIDLGDGATLTIVCSNGFIADNPVRVPGSDVTSEPNSRSIGVYVEYKDFDYLVAGDITGNTGAQVEQALRDLLVSISDSPVGDPLDVLRINHHGSNTSSEQTFLEDTMAETAVISCGDGNSYGHPTQEVVDRLVSVQGQLKCVYATEEGTARNWQGLCYKPITGAVVITTDGVEYSVTNDSAGLDSYWVDTAVVFIDGFESGDVSRWSSSVP
ncbi:MAG: MBL fold metallo-hydrolase [bacterium]|nr:MBL fold metallo-hydrolase [bacterium]